jgi:ABC-type multidrug transport system permease subunit
VGVTDGSLAAVLRSDPSLSVRLLDSRTAEDHLRLGRIQMLVLPAPGGGVRFRYDDTNSEARSARLLAERALQQAAGVRDRVPVTAEIVHEPGSRYIDFLVPGLLGMNLMGSGIWGVGFAIVDARRKKLLKRLVASPMSRAEYLLSFVLSRLMLLLLEVTALVGFGALVFGVPLYGSLWQFGILCLLASLTFSALGLLIASRARTIEAASGLMNFVMLPMWVFSGVFFSYERFPEVFHPFIRALPLTAVIDALRANMLQGAGLEALSAELAVMGAWLGVSFFTALKLFRWR